MWVYSESAYSFDGSIENKYNSRRNSVEDGWYEAVLKGAKIGGGNLILKWQLASARGLKHMIIYQRVSTNDNMAVKLLRRVLELRGIRNVCSESLDDIVRIIDDNQKKILQSVLGVVIQKGTGDYYDVWPVELTDYNSEARRYTP